MPKAKKAVVLKPKVVKSHFFLPMDQQVFEDNSVTAAPQMVKVSDAFQPRVKPRRFLFDKDTGEPYAEWINDDAVCLETGAVLFESRTKVRNDFEEEERRRDFRVPEFRRVDDPTIYTDDLVSDGVITLADFALNGASLTSDRVRAWLDSKKIQ